VSDDADRFQSIQERHLLHALAKAGVKPRVLTIPPPHYVDAPPIPQQAEKDDNDHG
jgi:hypothetical protein